MRPRVLAVVMPGQEGDVLAALPALIAVARAELSSVRIACFRALPTSPVDHGCGGTFLSDGHMARVSGAIMSTLRDAVRRFDDVSTEVVVRFGTPREEILTEVEVYEPAFVAMFAETSPLAKLRRWALRRRIGSISRARMLVLETRPGAWAPRVRDVAAPAG